MQSLHPSRIGLFVEVNVVVAFSENFGLKAILVKKVYEAGAVKDTVYYVDENFVRVANSSGTYDFTYVKHEGQLVAQLNPDGTKYFVHSDHEGSTSVVTDSNGKMLENTTYTPYGEILSGGAVSRFDSEGKEYSSYVGDYDFSFRKYKAEWGLFTQPDTLIQNVYDPQSLNRYSFERNNPYNRVDPTGHFIQPLLQQALYQLSRLGAWFFGDPVRVTRTVASNTIKVKESSIFSSPSPEKIQVEGTYVPPEAQTSTSESTNFPSDEFTEQVIKSILEKKQENKKNQEKESPKPLWSTPFDKYTHPPPLSKTTNSKESKTNPSGKRDDGSGAALARFWARVKASRSTN